MSVQTFSKDLFQYERLTRILGKPDFLSLTTIEKQIKANAMAVCSNLGGGNHGHLGLVITPQKYALLSNTLFIRPVHSGDFAIATNTTQVQARKMEFNHKMKLLEFQRCDAVEKALIY